MCVFSYSFAGEFEVSLKMSLCPTPFGGTEAKSVKLKFIVVRIKCSVPQRKRMFEYFLKIPL